MTSEQGHGGGHGGGGGGGGDRAHAKGGSGRARRRRRSAARRPRFPAHIVAVLQAGENEGLLKKTTGLVSSARSSPQWRTGNTAELNGKMAAIEEKMATNNTAVEKKLGMLTKLVEARR